ncbi:MAG: hypothetical protein LH679_23885 [Cyanobacteria bacterium CAN_BIN43]|nr:hypothetical protein [Cyanobacteria bacterium CAN_BIN43]
MQILSTGSTEMTLPKEATQAEKRSTVLKSTGWRSRPVDTELYKIGDRCTLQFRSTGLDHHQMLLKPMFKA